MKRMEDKLRDRLMSRNDRQIERQACEKYGKTNLDKKPAFLGSKNRSYWVKTLYGWVEVKHIIGNSIACGVLSRRMP